MSAVPWKLMPEEEHPEVLLGFDRVLAHHSGLFLAARTWDEEWTIRDAAQPEIILARHLQDDEVPEEWATNQTQLLFNWKNHLPTPKLRLLTDDAGVILDFKWCEPVLVSLTVEHFVPTKAHHLIPVYMPFYIQDNNSVMHRILAVRPGTA